MRGSIWAQSRDGVIGDGLDMPWHIPEDLAHFKDITLKHPVIMGRRTWESLPERFRPLPGRENLILSSRTPGQWSAGAEVITAVPPLEDAWIMGGGSVYAATLDDVSVLEVTIIDKELRGLLGDAAVLAPEIPADFEVVSDTGWLTSAAGKLKVEDDHNDEGTGVRYRFQRHERKTG